MSVVYRPGFYCDVTVLADGRFVHVVAEDPDVVAYVDGGVLWRTKAGRGLLELRCAFALGRVYAIGKEKDSAANVSDGGTVYLVTREGAKPIGLGFGAQSVAIDATCAYVVRSGFRYDRISLATGEVENRSHPVSGSSQGISDVEPDGTIRWADTSRTVSVNGLTLAYPNHRGAVMVGQADPMQIAGWRSGEMFTAIEGEAYEPHIAQSGDNYAICARTPKGAAFTVVPPFPAFVSGLPTGNPEPTAPSPKPKPEDPKPVPVQNRAAQLAAFHQQYNGGQPITDDAEKHRFTAAFASALNKQDGDTRWGRKARAGSDAVSKDTLGYWLGPLVPHNPTDGKVDAFDIIASTGAVSWDTRAEQNDPGYRSIDARWFPVSASIPEPAPGPDTLPPGGGPAPQTPAPTLPPEYLSRLSAIEDALKAVEEAGRAQREAMATLADAVKLLAAKPAPKYSGRIGGTGRFSTAIDLVPIA